jgi:hypothetical protein
MEDAAGLHEVGEYVLRARCGETVSEQTVTDYYDKKRQLRTTVVHKETRDRRGTSVRLIGSTLRHKEGYPPLVFDCGVVRAHGKVATSFSAFLPTVRSEAHANAFDVTVEKELSEKAIEFCLVKETSKIPLYLQMLPERLRTCGFHVRQEGAHLDLMYELKRISFSAYEAVLGEDPSDCSVEEFSNYLINNQSKNEHETFKRIGMSVPSKVQKAFFTLFVERSEFYG